MAPRKKSSTSRAPDTERVFILKARGFFVHLGEKSVVQLHCRCFCLKGNRWKVEGFSGFEILVILKCLSLMATQTQMSPISKQHIMYYSI